MGSRVIVAIAVLWTLAACGGGGETATIYLMQRLGPEGPPGQIAPVLTPVERTLRAGIATPYQVAQLVRQGPAPGEWGQGFVETIDPQTRIRSVSVTGSAATVELAGGAPDFYGSAALVYTLTSLPEDRHRAAPPRRQSVLRVCAQRAADRVADGDELRLLARGAVRHASPGRCRRVSRRILRHRPAPRASPVTAEPLRRPVA